MIRRKGNKIARKRVNAWKRYKVGKPAKNASKAQNKPHKPKEKSISKLIKEADAIMSRNVRYADLDENGLAHCYTCPYKAEPKKLQNGHYLSRYYKAARWHKDNTRKQCYVCNIQKKGDIVNFRQRLIAEVGEARVLAVEKLRDAPIKLTREFLNDLITSLKYQRIMSEMSIIQPLTITN